MKKIFLLKIGMISALLCLFCTFIVEAVEYDHIGRGTFYLKQGKVKKAIKEFEKEIEENPHLVDAYLTLGNLYQFKLKDNQKAIEVYLKGLKQSPIDYDLNLNIMYVYFDQEEIYDGFKHYVILANVRSENDSFSFPREILHELLKKKEQREKIDFCNEYLAMNPTDIILRETLADIYKSQKDYKKAESELMTILEQSKNSPDVYLAYIYFDLGTCNYNLGYLHKALEYFSRAKELGADVPQEFFSKLHKEIDKQRKEK